MFNDEISHFTNKGVVLVQGDLNARISNNPDVITSGKIDNLEEVEALSSHFTKGSIFEIKKLRQINVLILKINQNHGLTKNASLKRKKSEPLLTK